MGGGGGGGGGDSGCVRQRHFPTEIRRGSFALKRNGREINQCEFKSAPPDAVKKPRDKVAFSTPFDEKIKKKKDTIAGADALLFVNANFAHLINLFYFFFIRGIFNRDSFLIYSL